MYAQPSPRTSRVTTVDLSLDEHARRIWIKSLPEIESVHEILKLRMIDLGYPLIDRFAVHLVLREAVINALEHGQAAVAGKTVQITFAVRPDEVVIEIEEQDPNGEYARPSDRPPSIIVDRNHGWGKFKTQSYATWMCVDPPSNRLSFGRRRSDG